MPAKKKIAEEVADLMAVGADTPQPVQTGTNRLVTVEDLAADRAFVASLDEEADGQPPVAAADLGDVAADVPEAVAAEDQAGSQEPVGGPARGSINAMVKDLLADPDLSYEAIVDRVKAAHPGARTTARSVASTASVMRRKGETVPMRRK
jgi:hypothetical protein